MKILSDENIEILAKELARSQKITSKKNKSSKAQKDLNESFFYINSIYKKLNESYRNGSSTVPSSEWLLDNFYIIEEHAKQLKRDLKSKAYNNLPVIESGNYKGYSRIFSIATEIVKNKDGKIDEDIIEKFIRSYEEEQALYMREIWNLLFCLRIALINRISEVSEKIYETHLEWENAKKWVDEYDETQEIKLPISEINVNSSFFEHLAYILRRTGKKGLITLNRIDSYIDKYGLNIDKISHSEHQKQAALKISIGNCIISLKYISNIDFNNLFNRISVIEQIFDNEPAGIYKKMDMESKHAYRARVEYIATALKISEVHVAKKCLECANEFRSDNKKGHIGFYLWGKGQDLLERRLKSNIPKKYKLNQEIRNEPYSLYVSAIVVVATLITIAFYGLTNLFLTTNFVYYIGIIIVFIVAFDYAVCFVNYCFNRIFKPRIIPRIDYKSGIEDNVIVIVPTLLSSEKRVKDMLNCIEKYYVATNDKKVYFALVGDAKEALSETLPEDENIARIGVKIVEELNKKYNTNNFLFVYRKRFFNKSENKWLGFERKRGAIIRFNELLLNKNKDDYKVISDGFDNLPPIKYVLTVDADTFIPIGAVQKLVGAISHPLNAPVLNEEGTVVIEGYGLIQPHIGIDVVSASRSIFSKIFAGSGGIDPYVCASSDIYQDLFGEAIFTGKGIYDLNVFSKVLHKSIPENTVLSHDLLEGSYLRVGLATDVELIDGYPSKYNNYSMRAHRWVRGDWQIISWLFSRVKDASGNFVKNPINKISKWKIFDNLRRSLTASFAMIGIILGFSILPGNALWWTFFFLIAGIRGNKKQFILQLLFLPFTGWLMFSAVLKTLYRVFITKKNLLEWVTAADMETKLKNTVISYYRLMMSSIILGAIAVIGAFWLKHDIYSITASIVLFVLWTFAPLIAYLISCDIKDETETLTDAEISRLKKYAQQTFNYFGTFMNKENNYLPPDNFQEDPPNEVASRTSPTNIGLGLMALMCGYDLGFIDVDKTLKGIKDTLDTVDKLEKWNGHLLNWYNTKNLKPLFPRYISTVDSGNLLAYVITVKEGIKQLKCLDEGQSELKDSLVERLESIESNMHFDILYDKEKNVFSIGYNLEENRLTNSFYDLLASESRQISFLAVARHEVPVKHWFALSRNLTKINGSKGLISWTGTMFEYLMPLLLMRNYRETLLNETYNFVVKCQIEYSKKKNIKVWGISESAFYNFDINLNYQYKALGVPWLGLKRGLIEDTVISPYSTMLALMVKPKTALKNLVELEKLSMLGKYGFYESIDFTPGRIKLLNNNQKYAIVKSYMVHHQGMSLVSMDNVINNNIMQKRFSNNVFVKSAEILLQEKVPGDVIYTKDNKEKVVPAKEMKVSNIDTDRIIKNIGYGRPNVHILTNGNYYTMLNDRGTGFSKFRNIDITRKRSDYVLENNGQIFYIKCINNGQVWAASYQPRLKEPDKYIVMFSGDKAKITRSDGKIETIQEVVVSTEDNVEIRKIIINNNSDEDLEFEVTSYMELVMDNQDADIAHRVFSNMFINTFEEEEVLFAMKKKRNDNTKTILYSLSNVPENEFGNFCFETDRMSFIGRCRNMANPITITENKPLKNSIGAVLEPIIAQRRYLKISAKESGRVNFITGVAESKDEALENAKKYISENMISRAFRMAFARNQVELSYLNVTSHEVAIYDDLMKFLI